MPAGTVKLKTASSAVVCAAIGVTTVGASLVLVTSSVKVLVTTPRLPSSAVTSMLRVPTWSLSGVPLNVCVLASKLSHVGKAAPPVSWAVYVSASSASAKAFALN